MQVKLIVMFFYTCDKLNATVYSEMNNYDPLLGQCGTW